MNHPQRDELVRLNEPPQSLTRRPRRSSLMERAVSKSHPLASSIAWMCLPGLAGVLLAIYVFGVYGWPLFVYLPFMMGCGSVLLYSAHEERTLKASLKASSLSVMALAVILLVSAIEGAICIAMASPLGWLMAAFGGWVGYKVQRRAWAGRRPTLGLLAASILCAPMFMGAESTSLGPPEPREVTTIVVVDGDMAQSFKAITSARKLKPVRASDLEGALFKIGVGYPVEVRWSGQGVGARRLGRYSTGAFTQEVIAWEPDRRVKLRTTAQPIPMHELTPWGHFDAPHLHGHFKVLEAELALEPAPESTPAKPRTKIIARSTYTHSIWPAGYWHVFSDALMHAVHRRWLEP